MSKKTKIIIGVVVLFIIIISIKNIYIANEFEKAVYTKIEKEKKIDLLKADFSCSGIFSLDCEISDMEVSFKNRRNNMYINIDNLYLENISGIDAFNKKLENRTPSDTLKNLVKLDDSYSINIEGLRIYPVKNSDEMEKFKSKIEDEISKIKNHEIQEYYSRLFELYEDNGINTTFNIESSNGDFEAKSNIKFVGMNLGYTLDLQFDEDAILNSKNRNIKDAILKTEINNIEINSQTNEFSVAELISMYVNINNPKGSYRAKRFERNLKRTFGSNYSLEDFDEDIVIKLAKSEQSTKVLDSITRNLTRNIEFFIKGEENIDFLNTITKDIKEKIIALASDSDDSLKIEISMDDKTPYDIIVDINKGKKLNLEDIIQISVK